MPLLNDAVQTGFARKARSYNQHALVQADAAEWLSHWLPESTTDCLEFGAGTGLFSQYLPQHFASVLCTDLSEEMLQLCKERLSTIQTEVRNAWMCPTIPTLYDWIVSSSLLQWAPDPVEVLRQWKQQLSPNGRLLIGLFVDPSLKEMRSLMGGQSPLVWRTQQEWLNCATEAGLNILRTESRERVYHYPNARAFWRSLHDTGTTARCQTSVGSLRQCLAAYEASFGNDAGVRASWTTCRIELSH
ncbi:methyltransferase domain-containing protein [Coraliomargarita akajimensis]|uniref:Methyltransferase type 11 n=1 Tax=Coraliomargarita akajimensis (strain DSM 45221 / IAM 15411 / JCM 23193 / KCTC 12865 / 04OKA010-24) TaxID=583355 RepID=D5EPQ5_CORAD|nr:methyltransferase domain-containing protein [Coraliomargarita akajimensis]ADE53792.1 Methyltransferase type 11 [Coraliomargarita akajimensis DSM 45221]